MKRALILAMIMFASPSLAHDCCCGDGGMSKLSAGTVRAMEQAQFDVDIKEAHRTFDAYRNLRDALPLDSPWYPGVTQAYKHWADRLEGLQEQAIDEAIERAK